MDYKDIVKVNSEIKMTDIGRGKEYAEVPQRIQAFRKLFPEGTILTEIVSCEGGVCVMKATVMAGDTVLATGHAYEKEGSTFINKTSYIENCETSAVGRALAMVGIGSETSIASYEEVQNAKANQNAPVEVKRNDTSKKTELANEILRLAKEMKVPTIDICQQAGVNSIMDMHMTQMEGCHDWLKGLG